MITDLRAHSTASASALSRMALVGAPAAGSMVAGAPPPLTDLEYRRFQAWLLERAGIHLNDSKQILVTSRLARRLQLLKLQSFAAYFELIQRDVVEQQRCLDLLTTNETYFFREPRHFELLRRWAMEMRKPGSQFRCWSAAASTGQEAYSMAMVLADVFGKSSPEWSVHGTDLSSRVLEAAREATYYLRSGEAWPGDFLQRFCLKGVGPQEGRIAICPELVDKVSFSQMNLITPWPDMSPYSVVFLRNVMIYFQNDVKAKILKQMVRVVKPGGYLVVSQTESVSSLLPPEFKLVMPSIMQRVLP